MKKLLVVLPLLMILVGCGVSASDVGVGEIRECIQMVKNHAEMAGVNRKDYIVELEKFNDLLTKVNDDKLNEYVAIQTEANEMRIKGLQTEDYDLISDSSWKQAEALQVLESVK